VIFSELQKSPFRLFSDFCPCFAKIGNFLATFWQLFFEIKNKVVSLHHQTKK
jgi:hypothetical protein